MQMSGLHCAEEDSKQPQVSALPERRVKKQKWTALLGYFLCRESMEQVLSILFYMPLEYIIAIISAIGGAGTCRIF